ncbi:SAM-dependent methyltransferase [Spirosoma validum]|uniref:Class I SAM-dependent methyltransferase n=1 Tax=Spirosoma validum TaxID=2771355 RepID=A0A927GD25_9BACT|nr:class I SAM-dependent methyltransferase [Spirosoma validum]MBD2753233.1 class I SAM-dependent methyltransferase [Spirosoma validum]
MNITINDNWYTDFFSDLNCEMWTKAPLEAVTEREVNFLIDTLATQPGATLLDIPCGNGRHAVELAKRGFMLTGIDISAEFLLALQQQIASEQLPIQVIQGDLLTTPIGNSFDGAYCLGNSFGYVNAKGMSVFVKKVANALKPGARFVINSGLVAESILPNFPHTGHYLLGDLIMDIRNSYVVGDSYMATEITYTKADRTEVHYFKHYVYTLSEVKRLLNKYGLRTIAVYNSTEKTDYQLGDQQMYLIAEKS